MPSREENASSQRDTFFLHHCGSLTIFSCALRVEGCELSVGADEVKFGLLEGSAPALPKKSAHQEMSPPELLKRHIGSSGDEPSRVCSKNHPCYWFQPMCVQVCKGAEKWYGVLSAGCKNSWKFGSVALYGRRLFNCRRGKPRRYLYHFAAVSIVANRYSPFATT